jgi:hypothetical protein
LIDKIPYKFKYHFIDDEGRESTMTIEDWEIGALYRNEVHGLHEHAGRAAAANVDGGVVRSGLVLCSFSHSDQPSDQAGQMLPGSAGTLSAPIRAPQMRIRAVTI